MYSLNAVKERLCKKSLKVHDLYKEEIVKQHLQLNFITNQLFFLEMKFLKLLDSWKIVDQRGEYIVE